VKIHSSLFPVAQRVLNPPSSTPTLAKDVLHICGSLQPYLTVGKVAGLVTLK
jgi:hypothetical protein